MNINPNKYQVFLCACPANLPFFFAIHPWLVVNKKGIISRFGLSQSANVPPDIFGKINDQKQWGHLYKNFFPPWQGIRILPFAWKYFWRGHVLSSIEGDENSLAYRMAEFIESSGENYPDTAKYSLLGPNSNTYVQWVLSHFPEADMSLPWNAFGKGVARRML